MKFFKQALFCVFLLFLDCRSGREMDFALPKHPAAFEPDRYQIFGPNPWQGWQDFQLDADQVFYLISNQAEMEVIWQAKGESIPLEQTQMGAWHFWRIAASAKGCFRLIVRKPQSGQTFGLGTSRIFDELSSGSHAERALLLELEADAEVALKGNFSKAYEASFAQWAALGRERDLARVAQKLAESWVAEGEPGCAAVVLAAALAQIQPGLDAEAALQHDYAAALQREGSYQLAIHAYGNALQARTHPSEARADSLAELGFLYGFLGQFEQGVSRLEEAERIFKASGDGEHLAMVRSNLGWLKYQLGERENGILLCKMAAEMAREDWGVKPMLFDRLAKIYRLELRQNEALALYSHLLKSQKGLKQQAALRANIGETLVDKGDFSKAIETINACMPYFKQANSQAELAHLRYLRGRAQAGLKQTKRALADLENALHGLDLELKSVSDPLLRSSYLAARYDYFEFYLDLLLPQAENVAQQLEKVERRRAQALLERLELKNPSVANRTRSQDKRLGMDQNYLVDLLGRDATLLYFAMGKEQVWLWVQNQEGFHRFSLGKREPIEQAAETLALELKSRNRQRFAARAAQSARDLGSKLLSQAAPFLRGNRLVIVADGALLKIPFAVLSHSQQDNARLLDRFELVMVPSLAGLAAIRARERREANGVLLFADPAMEPERGLPALVYGREEAQAIAAFFPNSRLLMGTEASKAQLQRFGSQAGMLHFSVHSLHDPSRNDFLGLLLATRNALGMPCEGVLTVGEIRELNLQAELVVLSSCETNLGQAQRGEGLSRLSQGFFEAGARSLLTSYWKVDDQATAILMAAFYRYLSQPGHLPARALRFAQSEMAKDSRWQDPHFWAGFSLQGDWNGLSERLFSSEVGSERQH